MWAALSAPSPAFRTSHKHALGIVLVTSLQLHISRQCFATINTACDLSAITIQALVPRPRMPSVARSKNVFETHLHAISGYSLPSRQLPFTQPAGRRCFTQQSHVAMEVMKSPPMFAAYKPASSSRLYQPTNTTFLSLLSTFRSLQLAVYVLPS